MASGPSRELTEKRLNVRAHRPIRLEGAHERAIPAVVLLLSAKLARPVAKLIPINLGMRISSVSILDVYSRTIENAFSLVLLSGNSGKRRLRMSITSGVIPNGSPVQRIRGVPKMYKNEFDLVPLRCAIDEARGSMALRSEVKTPEDDAAAGGKASWCRQVLARPIVSSASYRFMACRALAK